MLFLLLVTILLTPSSPISFQTMKLVFEATYDTDQSGYATMDEFISYFTFLQPDHNISASHISEIFNTFDSDSNDKVTLSELMQMSHLKLTKFNVSAGHKQLHLGLTANENQMQIMWVSQPEKYHTPIVQYGRFPLEMNNTAHAETTTYNVGHFGFHGQIYHAVMKDLIPLKTYYYRVGDSATKTFSSTKSFKAPPVHAQYLPQIRFAVFGDMGTFAPFGHVVAKRIAKDHFIHPLDFVFLTGDIAYSGMNSEKVGQFQPIWDLFGELTQKFAASCAFMPGVGNHEKYYNYTSYMKRYILPRHSPQSTNLWFSFDYGQVHVIHFSSQHPYERGSDQYEYLEKDLKKARANPNTKWIILGVHRAFYSSDANEYANVTNLARNLEELVLEYRVDIVQTGHLHDYERTWPTVRGRAMKEGQTENHFINPIAPIYVVQGTAGALIREKFINPQPQWSLKRMMHYGYGRITIDQNTLTYQFIGAPSGKIHDRWLITKDI